MKLLAQNIIDGGPIGGPANTGMGPFSFFGSQLGSTDTASPYLEQIISTAIGVMTIIAGIWFIFNLFVGAVGIVVGSGNQDSIKTNTNKITHSLMGLVIVIAAYAVIGLIGSILGFDILNIQGLVGTVSF